jgi:hypothetical protein
MLMTCFARYNLVRQPNSMRTSRRSKKASPTPSHTLVTPKGISNLAYPLLWCGGQQRQRQNVAMLMGEQANSLAVSNLHQYGWRVPSQAIGDFRCPRLEAPKTTPRALGCSMARHSGQWQQDRLESLWKPTMLFSKTMRWCSQHGFGTVSKT